MHDLRVLTRRIRSAAWVARHLAPACQFRILRSVLRRLGRTLGRRRMLDVARADAADYGLDGARLDRRRAREGAALAQELDDVSRVVVVAGLRESARILGRAREERLAGALEGHLVHLQSALARAPRGREPLHQLRIQVKKTRYLLEALGRRAEFLRELQRRIGRSHDLQVLQELFREDPRIARHESRARLSAHRIMGRVVERAVREVHDAVLALRGLPRERPVPKGRPAPVIPLPAEAAPAEPSRGSPEPPPDDAAPERAAS